MGFTKQRFRPLGSVFWMHQIQHLVLNHEVEIVRLWERMPSTPDQTGQPLGGPFLTSSSEFSNSSGGGGGIPGALILGKTTQAISKNSSGTVYGYTGPTPGAETVTSNVYTAYNRFGDIAAGAWVYMTLTPFGKYDIVQAECKDDTGGD